ncbi:hypothetical protein Q644_14815 [Brucella intermedia 229E]|uniref:Uncharacterized protein n=1 Tax=Brucella intermedia 229E TaxID=1337887 RepID=U4VCL5_9HYPH|nr:hypothetical protein Q644_14815 [Brucella intermedia 229E]
MTAKIDMTIIHGAIFWLKRSSPTIWLAPA